MACTVREASEKWDEAGVPVILDIWGVRYRIEYVSQIPATFLDWYLSFFYLPDGYDAVIVEIVPPWDESVGGVS